MCFLKKKPKGLYPLCTKTNTPACPVRPARVVCGRLPTCHGRLTRGGFPPEPGPVSCKGGITNRRPPSSASSASSAERVRVPEDAAGAAASSLTEGGVPQVNARYRRFLPGWGLFLPFRTCPGQVESEARGAVASTLVCPLAYTPRARMRVPGPPRPRPDVAAGIQNKVFKKKGRRDFSKWGRGRFRPLQGGPGP